jgi:butyrate kinase
MSDPRRKVAIAVADKVGEAIATLEPQEQAAILIGGLATVIMVNSPVKEMAHELAEMARLQLLRCINAKFEEVRDQVLAAQTPMGNS